MPGDLPGKLLRSLGSLSRLATLLPVPSAAAHGSSPDLMSLADELVRRLHEHQQIDGLYGSGLADVGQGHAAVSRRQRVPGDRLGVLVSLSPAAMPVSMLRKQGVGHLGSRLFGPVAKSAARPLLIGSPAMNLIVDDSL